MSRRHFLLQGAAGSLAAIAPRAFAQQRKYPEKPIKFVVPFAAGSAADTLSRVVAAQLAEQLGQAVVVENRLGAGGSVGTAEIANAAPDGYVLGLAAQGTMVANQVLNLDEGLNK